MCSDEVGILVRVTERMNSTGYLNVLSDAMLPSAWSFRGLDFMFQHALP